MGFVSFRLEVLHPDRGRLTPAEPAGVAEAPGHPVRQLLVHL